MTFAARHWLLVFVSCAFIFELSSVRSNMTAAGSAQAASVDTAVVVNGNRRVFLYGMYHVSWAGSRADKDRALRNIAAAGYNLMFPAIDTLDRSFLDEANRLGVYIIAEDNEPLRDLLAAFRSHPAVIGFLTSDDFNRPSAGHTVSKTRTEHTLINAHNPNLNTYISGGYQGLAPWFSVTELMGLQTYSVPSDPLSTTDRLLRLALQQRGSRDVSLIANIQAFADGARPPTALEVRNMTYQALLNDVDGIIYYTYLDPSWNIERSGALWTEIRKLGPELRQFAPIMLGTTVSRITMSQPDVLVGRWRYRGVTYLAVINTSNQTVSGLRIAVSERSATNMFSGRPATLRLTNRELTGSIGSQQVQVYVLR